MSCSKILSLPNEIIFRIVDDIPSVDIGSFALCNKAIYSLCEDAIQRIFEDRYGVVRLGSPEHRPAWYSSDDLLRGCHPLLFLDRILSNPKIARYPTELQIEIYIEYFDGDSSDDDEDRIEYPQRATFLKAIAKWKAELVSFGADNPWLAEITKREEWRSALLEPSNQVYFLGILFTMLPNVESITITNMSFEARPLMDMVSAIAAANRDLSSPVHGIALSKLHEVALESILIEEGTNAKYYEPFATLPSMRSLHGNKIGGSPATRPPDLLQGLNPTDCQVTMIKFVHSAINPFCFERLIGMMTSLKTFTYYHALQSAGEDRFDAHNIVRTLAKYASHSLEKLDLTAEAALWCVPEDDPQFQYQRHQRIPSLQAFDKLRVLRIDDILLQDPYGAVTRLVDMLPTSIRVVRLVREMRHHYPEKIFADLATEKEQRLPSLRKIVMEGYMPLPEGFVHELKTVGVEVRNGSILI